MMANPTAFTFVFKVSTIISPICYSNEQKDIFEIVFAPYEIQILLRRILTCKTEITEANYSLC